MNTYLFADPSLIESSRDVVHRVNPPIRAEPVITREYSWERVLLGLYLTVIDDENTTKIWYGCRSSKANTGKHTAYAESTDGVTFTKRGLVIPETMEGTTYLDPNEDPARRYGYFGNLIGEGLFRWTSSDGVQFKRDAKPLLEFESDTQCVLLWDDLRSEYAAYLRGWNTGKTKNDRRRTVMRLAHDRADSPWPFTPSVAALEATKTNRLPHFHDESDIVLQVDERDPEETDIYTMVPCRYGSGWVAFPTFYRHFLEPDEGRYINGGRTSVQCLWSSDGISWQRYDRRSYAAPMPGEHMVYMGQGLIHHGDEIWQYGIGFNTHHGEVEKRFRHGDGTMYRFVQRVDGFVSADSETDGFITTRPIEWSGRRLLLNIDTDGIGIARVGVLDAAGTAIPDFGLRECDPITTNNTGAEVTWNGGVPERLRGQMIKFEIRSTRTKLYSLRFED